MNERGRDHVENTHSGEEGGHVRISSITPTSRTFGGREWRIPTITATKRDPRVYNGMASMFSTPRGRPRGGTMNVVSNVLVSKTLR